MMRRAFVIAMVLAAAAGCAKHAGAPKNAQTPGAVATLLIESKGVTMPLGLAVHTLRFRPFIPNGELVQVALIPPLNVEQQKQHGIAIEYAARGNALLLSQWPRAGNQLTIAASDITARPCAPVAYKTDGLIWATRNGLVMTLQPDGPVPASRVADEAQRLLRAGACGEPARTLPRSRSRSRAVSSPRRSAS